MSEPRPPFIRRVFREWWRDDVVFIASAITFDALVAAVPLLMLVLALTGAIVTFVVPGGQLDLLAFLRGAFPETRIVDLDPLLRVEELLVGVATRREAISLLSIPLLFLFATRMFATVRWGLDRVFDAAPEHRRPLARQWLTDSLLVVVTGLFLLTNGVASIGLAVLSTTSGMPWAAPAGGMITSATAFGLFVSVFRVAPARRIDWIIAALAGGLAAIFFEVAKRIFGLYVQYVAGLESMTADVQLTGLLLVLAWFYANALAFLTAGEIANEYRRARPLPAARPGPGP